MTTLKLFFTVTALAATSLAQDDPPARAARLNHIDGQVSFLPVGTENWEAAPLNRPLITGDRIWADEGSRAELHVGSAAVRLGSATSFTFLNLDDRRMQAELVQGSLIVRLREIFDDETYEIDTPHVSFFLLRTGEYRVDVQPDGSATILTVRSGEAEASSEGQTFAVRPQDQVRISGTGRLTFDARSMPGPDGFDQWARERDIREDRSQSAQYVGRGVIGYEDLDDHGVWTEEPSYGRVWVPRGVPAGWEPYRYGHWSYIPPWGWTWIDDAPWGFAPFHYGRWVMVGVGWAWIPGPRVSRPVYAPAMVAWVGGPPRARGSVSVGWFPLGPREVYVPAHRASVAYVSRVNITNTRVTNVQVTNVYNNTTSIDNQTYAHRQRATVISQNDMASGRRVQRAFGMIPPDAAQNMQVTRTVDVAPLRTASAEARPAASVPPPNVVNRRTSRGPMTQVPRPVQEDRGLRRPVEAQRPVETRQNEQRQSLRDRPVSERSEDVTPPRRAEPPAGAEQKQPRERFEPRQETRPQRAEPPAWAAPRQEPRPPRVEPPARVEPRQESRPQRVEPPARVEPRQEPRPQRVEPPARVEPRQEQRQQQAEPPARVEPRQESRPQRVEPPPRVEPRQEARPQRAEPPAWAAPRQEAPPPRVEPPARVEPRQEPRQERKAEAPAREEPKR